MYTFYKKDVGKTKIDVLLKTKEIEVQLVQLLAQLQYFTLLQFNEIAIFALCCMNFKLLQKYMCLFW